VREGETPAQVLVAGQFRYTVEAAARGAELPQFALASPGYGDWVVLIVNAHNWSESNATLAVPDFRVAPLGAPESAVTPDVASASVAQFLGFSPAYDANDRVLFAPGETHQLALVFLVSPDAGQLMLLVGDQALDLGPALASAAGTSSLNAAPREPSLLEGKVVDVLDATTIVVAVGNERVTVRYLGVEGPARNACYAAEATAANANLVLGQTVWLERERKNRFSDDVYARDVWIERDGTRVLAARELAAMGAVVPAPAEPDTRYAGWIAAASAAAQASGQGLWGACGGLAPAS
jgi:endonuclease YncB( thermonuclease family)